MRIGWATPYNGRSAIGRFSRIVCEELVARGHDVVVIRLEQDAELELELLPAVCAVIDAENADVHEYDVLVVNFGNHAPYHAAMLSLIAKRAPIAIFHDAEMRDFEWGMRDRHGIGIPLAPGLVDEQPVSDGKELVNPLARPILGTFAAMSCGAIIHGPHYRTTVTSNCAGPVAEIPLCYPDSTVGRGGSPLKDGNRVVIFGVISEYKQPKRVMQAIAAAQPRIGKIELHLAGAIDENYREELRVVAASLGVLTPTFHGYLPDDELHDVLGGANAICCLRYPITEGGSASLIGALHSGRPLIIPDVASYSMVPDELAYKISYGNEVEDLAAALVQIFTLPAEAEARAARAQEWAATRFTAGSYVDALEPFLLSIGAHATRARLASSFVQALSAPANESMSAALTAAAEVCDWMHACQKRV